MDLRQLVKDAPTIAGYTTDLVFNGEGEHYYIYRNSSGLYKQVGEYMIAIRGTFGTDWTIVTCHRKGVLS